MKGSNSVELDSQSVFDRKSVQRIHKEVQEIYLADQRPWVIGYSGGKDSTTSLQLIWYALAGLPKDKRRKTVYVISTDTLVETPIMIDYVVQTLKRIGDVALKESMPFKIERLKPIIEQSFWVNLIGRGYPAPQQRFRWCTDRLKIQPSNRFIEEQISKFGEVVLVLGIRKEESSTRAQVENLRIPTERREQHGPDSVLLRHSKFQRAYIYVPIKDWSTNDVWNYLLQIPSPWGSNNRDLVAIYRSAQGECPLVVDDTTPSCGNSRFGCWVCTVVEKEKSMRALIDSGETWLQPLLDLRDLLAQTHDPRLKPFYREYKRKSGMVSFKSDGSGIISRGPYKLEFCRQLLMLLLKAQTDIRAKGPDPRIQLILPEELHEIRRIWKNERGDWEDSIPRIYRETTGQDLEWPQDDVTFSSKEKSLLLEICEKHAVPVQLVMKLFDAELQTQGMSRRSSIHSKIDKVLSEEWRTEEEIMGIQDAPDRTDSKDTKVAKP